MNTTNEIEKLQQEIAKLRQAIANFCEGQEWACHEWKQQPHIAPLFDINNGPPKTNQPKPWNRKTH